MPTVFGAPVSPFVRKVRVGLYEKNVDHEINPMPPFPPCNDTTEYRAMSPLGKIPASQDGDFGISDSSVILAYLDRAHPEPSLYPSDAKDHARALWFEEFADTKMVEGIGAVFFNRIVKPNFLSQEPDEAAIEQALSETIPFAFDYLNGQIDGEYLVGGAFSIADISVGSMLRQFLMTGESIDSARWSNIGGYADSIITRASFQQASEAENKMMSGA